jgi:hypothetical protein
MPIFSAVGLGIFIIVLETLAPALWTTLEHALISLLQGADMSVNIAAQIAGTAAAKLPH